MSQWSVKAKVNTWKVRVLSVRAMSYASSCEINSSVMSVRWRHRRILKDGLDGDNFSESPRSTRAVIVETRRRLIYITLTSKRSASSGRVGVSTAGRPTLILPVQGAISTSAEHLQKLGTCSVQYSHQFR